jgi:Arc/MetJ family transcription regulator
MNQRMRNRSRNAAMFLGKLVERRNGNRIAQHDSDLPALRTQRRLTLRARLGLGHDLSLRVLRIVTTHGIRAAVGHVARRPTGERLAVNSHIERAIRFFGDRDRRANRERFGEFLAEHGRLRSGPIPPMSESYAVTSDVSTTFDIASQQDSA